MDPLDPPALVAALPGIKGDHTGVSGKVCLIYSESLLLTPIVIPYGCLLDLVRDPFDFELDLVLVFVVELDLDLDFGRIGIHVLSRNWTRISLIQRRTRRRGRLD